MGINDPAAILIGAKDPESGKIYFYKEYYQRDKVLAQVATAWKSMVADIPQGCLHMPLIDPSSKKRSKSTGKSYKQLLQIEYGIVTKLAVNDIEDGIQRVKNMMHSGMLIFFNTLTETLREGCEYRYPTLEERSKNKNLGEKPLDKDNHLMDCLRYICQELPYEFVDMRRMTYDNYVKFFEEQRQGKTNKTLSFKELIDIINEDNIQEKVSIGQSYAGGYTI